MTREERDNALKVLKNYDLNFHKINGMLFSAEEIANAFDMAIKALEQEPILDKIRAEIEQEIIPRNSDQYDHEAMWQNLGLRMALKVIGKYKAESENP